MAEPENVCLSEDNTESDVNTLNVEDLSSLTISDPIEIVTWLEAAQSGDLLSLERMCLEPNFNCNQTNSNGDTALIWASLKGQTDVVQWLLRFPDIDVNMVSKNGSTALLLAASSGHYEITEMLCQMPEIAECINYQFTVDKGTPLIAACEANCLQSVKAILQVPGVDVNAKSAPGDTALIWASLNAHPEIIKELLKFSEIDVNTISNNGSTPLYLAATVADNGEVVEMLCQMPNIEKIINYQSSEEKNTPLIAACQVNCLQSVKAILQVPGVDINVKTVPGDTALIWASLNANPEIVKELLKCSEIDVNTVSNNGSTALYLAAAVANNGEVVEMLCQMPNIEKIINYQSSEEKDTPLLVACQSDCLESVKAILRVPGVSVNISNALGDTALIWASLKGNTEIVEELLRFSEIEVNKVSNNGSTALLLAASIAGNDAIVRMLCQMPEIAECVNNQDTEDKCTPLIFACRVDCLQSVKALLQVPNININACNSTGDTALVWASLKGNTEIVRELLSFSEIDVNRVSNNGSTALQLAATVADNGEVVEMLCRRPDITAIINDQSVIDKRTPLIAACQANCLQSVKAILQVPGVDINAKSVSGDTALIWASLNANPEIVKELLKCSEIDVNTVSNNGSTPLYLAATVDDNIEVVEMLCQMPNIEKTINYQSSQEKNTPLICASQVSCVESVKAILRVPGVNVNAVNSFGDTALIWASLKGNTEIVEELLKFSEINVNVVSNNKSTAFSITSSETIKGMILYAMFGGKIGHLEMLDNRKTLFGKESWKKWLFFLDGDSLSYLNPEEKYLSDPSIHQKIKVTKDTTTRIELNEYCSCGLKQENDPAYANRYSSSKNTADTIKGVVGKNNCIELRTKSQDNKTFRTFYMQAESLDEATEWVNIINKKIFNIKESRGFEVTIA